MTYPECPLSDQAGLCTQQPSVLYSVSDRQL